MVAIEKGRICILTSGRRAGEEVVITKVVTDNFALVKTSDGKERKASIRQLEPTSKTQDVQASA
jgi:ribosomal protein L14E/L6E/L27E